MGIFGASPEAIRPYIKDGYTLIAIGMDTMIFGAAVKKIADTSR